MEAEQEEGLEGNAASVRVGGREMWGWRNVGHVIRVECAFMIPCDAMRGVLQNGLFELVQSG